MVCCDAAQGRAADEAAESYDHAKKAAASVVEDVAHSEPVGSLRSSFSCICVHLSHLHAWHVRSAVVSQQLRRNSS